MKKSILLLAVLTISVLTGFSQRFDYDKSSNVFFGLNMGSTWQTTDVINQTRPIGGGGFIFGGTIGRDYGRAVSFDLRFRYLGGRWYGQDSDTTSAITQNIALSNTYGSTGYAVQNFRTTNHSLSLELAMHANRLRETTGWDPYIFAGIGAKINYTDGDLLDENGVAYDYAANPTSTFSVSGYDTPLDLNETSTHDEARIFNSFWAPSVGIGIGYYFGNRFSIGLEHKTTFTGNDYFDGTIVNQNGVANDKNDLYHYTSVYARWYLRRGNRTHTTPPPPPVTDPNVYTGMTQQPVVTFTNPNTTPKVVNSPTFILRADILHVSTAQNVTFRQEGIVNHNFTFNPLTTKFQSTVQLNPGQNVFRLRGTNQYGADEATVVIIYERDEVIPNDPPIVTITDPSVSPHTTNNSTYNVKSTIVNVSAKNQVVVNVNGTNYPNFTYSQLSTNQAAVTVLVNLQVGVNTVLITATNPSGQDSDQATIIKREEIIVQPPVVSFFNPSQQSITVNSPNFNLVGQVLHVDSKNNVAFFQNGNANQNFTFNATNKDFTSQVILVPGQNIFQLVGSNSAGTDQKTVVINYNIPSPKPPIVTITNPAIQPHTTNNNTHNLVATVLNVTNANQINMLLNGASFTNFTFNANNSMLNATLPLQEGMNTVKVTGTNADGTDSKQTIIVYKKPVVILPPVVEFVNPGINPYQTNSSSHGVIASVFNVTTSNQINVNLNGQTITNFTFNPTTHLVTFTAPLIPGANTVTVTGSNSAGVDSKNQTIIYVDPSTQLPPVVTYLDPSVNPSTVFTASYPVTAKVQHVASAQNIVLKINGATTTNFVYSTNSELMNFTTSLLVGANIIEITATNNYGQDIESTTIIYKKPDLVLPPVVTITTPSSEPHVTVQQTISLDATVLNVNSIQDIEVIVNGTSTTNFTFNNSIKKMNINVPLIQGNNTVKVIGTNAVGTDSDTRTIIYNPEQVVEPPYVTYINPSTPGLEVSLPTYQMVAQVVNVEQIAGINVIMNGQTISPALYTFNPVNKEVVFNTNLNVGNNTFYVQGTNSAGSHSASTNVVYKQPVVACDLPEISFIAPSTTPITVEQDYFDVHALVHHVTNANQIVLKVNGFVIGNFMYSPASHELIRKVDLTEGNNVIEIEATNNCGKTETNTLIVYHPAEAPCDAPEVNIITPVSFTTITQDATATVTASVTNIDNSNQIVVKVNGVPVSFSYDAATHIIEAVLNLNEGGNNVTIDVTNDCGTAQANCRIKREVCSEPVITISHNGIVVGGVVKNEQLTISGTIVNSTNVGFVHNGTAKNFVFDANNGSFSATVTLVEGINNFTVHANNNCGDASQSISATYEPVVVVLPPTVTITDPSVSPYETGLPNKSVVAEVTNVSTSANISVTNNGANTGFNFDPSTGIVTFSASLIEGSNMIVVTAANQSGTASDDVKIIYTKPAVIKPPVVQITFPSVSPYITSEGTYEFKGAAEHLDNAGQLEVLLNGQPFPNVITTVSNGFVNFTVPIVLNSIHPEYQLIAIATNSAGSDQASAIIELEEVVVDTIVPNCLPTVGAQFAVNHQSVTATSSLDLSNVVLQFSDGTTQKFDGLSGLTGTFSGTGTHTGKCITGIWIKSGCNQSGDGPGYGEWISNASYDGSCETTPCITPTMSVMSGVDVANASYSLQVVVNDATANNITVTLNGAVVNANYNTANNLLSASLTLTPGANEIVITLAECETVSETININYTSPCNPVTYGLGFPAQTNTTVTDAVIPSLNLSVLNVVNAGINATVNGTSVPFVLNGNNLSVANINLSPGQNTIIVALSNDCSNETITYTVNYEAPVGPCGPRINPGNSEWQFCLVTPSGTYNRNDLASNPNFTYSGPASSVYFLPIAGGGDVTVNGSPYSVQNGTYYLFEGNINVTVSSNQPGAMGHWTVCLETDQMPSSGKGNNRPPSPCDAGKALQNGGNGGAINGTPTNGTRQPNVTPKPGRTVEPQKNTTPTRTTGTQPSKEVTKPRTNPTRPTGGVTVPTKEKEKVDTNTSRGGVRQPIEKPTGGIKRN